MARTGKSSRSTSSSMRRMLRRDRRLCLLLLLAEQPLDPAGQGGEADHDELPTLGQELAELREETELHGRGARAAGHQGGEAVLGHLVPGLPLGVAVALVERESAE